MSQTSVPAERVSSRAWFRAVASLLFLVSSLAPVRSTEPSSASDDAVAPEWNAQANSQSLIVGQPAAVASSLSDNIVGMTSWTKHPKEAAKLLEWMTSKEFGEAFQKGEGVKSTASGVNAPYSPYQKDWDALFPKSIPFPPDLGPTVNGDGPAVVGDILAGTLTPEAAVAKFQALQDADNKTGY